MLVQVTVHVVELLASYQEASSFFCRPCVLSWSHVFSLYYVGTRAGTVHIVHVKKGDEGDGLSLELNNKSLK